MARISRRDFLKYGATGLAGLGLGLGTDLSWLAELAAADTSGPWKFGVMADTQWLANVDGLNPCSCAVGIINLVNQQFINQGVKFVIQVGDLVDTETDGYNGHSSVRTMPTRAGAAQALYDAGIGFFPLRGNHESSRTAATEFQTLYPQARGLGNTWGATNFASPGTIPGLNGLTYSFDFNNVRFVLLDQFVRTDNTATDANSAILDQLSWVDSTLSGRTTGTHAFVLGHKNLVGQNHTDVLTGANPGANPTQRNAYISSLQNNGVRYTIGGHDHMHHRSIVTSPDGTASVKQLIASSNSYKFYTPGANAGGGLYNDAHYDSPTRENPLAQELYTIGYYIFTVDGPKLTVDFYSTSAGINYSSVSGGITVTPTTTNFVKRETWGYSLNGREFVVAEGGTYTGISDTWGGTTGKIIAGTNGNTSTDYVARPLAKAVNTGWAVPTLSTTASNVLSLWGLQDNLALYSGTGILPATARTNHADTYVLQMSYTRSRAHTSEIGRSHFGIGSKDASGNWVNAVNLNTGGSKRFVVGPYNSRKHKLGTYGYNPKNKTCWAVINYDGDFAVTRGI
jgi:hypothetical protein